MRAWLTRALSAVAAGAVAALAAGLGLILCVDAGMFRGPLIRLMADRARRPVEVAGPLHVHLLARHPTLTAERVTIGAPSWAPAGPVADIGEASLTLDLPWLDDGFGVAELTLEGATLHFRRDAAGHANWQWRDPDAQTAAGQLPILRRLSIPRARVTLDDQRRHLQFDGLVTADGNGRAGAPLRIEGRGQLNGRADSFEISGDPLATARHGVAYGFSFEEHSSGSVARGRGSLPAPFDIDILDSSFEATGDDLADLYFLAGVRLFNTGRYRLSGKILRRGTLTRFVDLAAASGASDAHGSFSVDVSAGRPRFQIDLDSQLLRTADLGLRAAGRGPPGEPRFVLSDAAFKPSTLRIGDGEMRLRANHLQIGRFELTQVDARGALTRGVLEVAPLEADFIGGKFDSHLRIDARTDEPKSTVDMHFTHLELAGVFRKTSSPPPAHGMLRVDLAVTGTGNSVHRIAATADGTVTASVLDGAIRDSFAELTGVDLRGFGLLLTKNMRDTGLRCAIAEFDDHGGTLNARRLIVDTEPVLITGQGSIDLGTETLHLAIRGHPKSVRWFRFRSPVLIEGTLRHPTVTVRKSGLQLLDTDAAQDANCGLLRSEVEPPG